MAAQGTSTYFSPDEIHIELPRPGTNPNDIATDLIAVLPKVPTAKSAAGKELANVAKGTIIDVWEQDVPEKEIDAAADVVLEEVTAAGIDPLKQPKR